MRLVGSRSVWNTRQWAKSGNLVVISEIQKGIVSHKAVVSTCYSEVSTDVTYVKFWIKEYTFYVALFEKELQ